MLRKKGKPRKDPAGKLTVQPDPEEKEEILGRVVPIMQSGESRTGMWREWATKSTTNKQRNI